MKSIRRINDDCKRSYDSTAKRLHELSKTRALTDAESIMLERMLSYGANPL